MREKEGKEVAELVDLASFDADVPERDKKAYKSALAELQLKMLRIQQAYYHGKRRAVIVFEGVDAAGKGGIIRRLVETLDPRGVKVWPIGVPTEEEKSHHYLYRFWKRMPEAGTLAIFDRSWYGRVLVERIEGFCDAAAWKRAYREINEFERMLHDDGVRVIKLMPVISLDEQAKRFEERIRNPYKRWKLTADDIRNRKKWSQYQKAFQTMLNRTSTETAPWHVIAANRKWHARVEGLRIVTDTLAAGVDITVPAIDPKLMREAIKQLGIQLHDE